MEIPEKILWFRENQDYLGESHTPVNTRSCGGCWGYTRAAVLLDGLEQYINLYEILTFILLRSFTWMILIRNVSSVNVTSVTVGAILFIPLPSVLFISGHVSGCLFLAEVVRQTEWLMDWWSHGRYPLSSVYWTVASNTNFSLLT